MDSNIAVKRKVFLSFCEALGEEEEGEEGKVGGNGENAQKKKNQQQDEQLVTLSSLEREIC